MVLWILSNRLALPVLLCVVRPLPQNTGDYNPIVLESNARFESDFFMNIFRNTITVAKILILLCSAYSSFHYCGEEKNCIPCYSV